MSYDTRPIPGSSPPVAHITRPWGSFRQYALNEQVTVSLMTVKPGMRLSLQSHTGRGELWIVLDPGAEIQIGNEVYNPQPNAEFWIPANTRHRLTSTRSDLRVLEIAFGNWQQEDIIRYEDDFNRAKKGE